MWGEHGVAPDLAGGRLVRAVSRVAHDGPLPAVIDELGYQAFSGFRVRVVQQ
jgi:hypothetical protein